MALYIGFFIAFAVCLIGFLMHLPSTLGEAAKGIGGVADATADLVGGAKKKAAETDWYKGRQQKKRIERLERELYERQLREILGDDEK